MRDYSKVMYNVLVVSGVPTLKYCITCWSSDTCLQQNTILKRKLDVPKLEGKESVSLSKRWGYLPDNPISENSQAVKGTMTYMLFWTTVRVHKYQTNLKVGNHF